MIKKLFYKLNSSIQLKFFGICMLAALIPILIFGLLAYELIANSIENDYKDYKIALGQQVMNTLDDNIKSLVRQTIGMYVYENNLKTILLYSPAAAYNTDYIASYDYLTKSLNRFLQANNNVYGVTFADKNGHIKFHIDRQFGGIITSDLSSEDWFDQAMAINGNYILLEPHDNAFTYKEIAKQKVISVVAGVINLETSEPYGLMKIDQSVSELNSIMMEIDLGEGEIILLLGKNGDIIYSNTSLTSHQTSAVSDMITSESYENGMHILGGEKVLINKVILDKHSWSLVSITPYSVITSKSDFVLRINITLLTITTLVMFFVSFLLSNVVVSPLKKLSRSFGKLKNGDFNTHISVAGHDELAQINSSFNDMVASMKNLIEERYEANIQRLQAEIQTLQSQINPHFLYNTLNSIKALADIEQMLNISTMIKYLSDLFRYNLNRNQNIVQLNDEIEHVKKYLYLQNVRFSNIFNVIWDIDPLTTKCEILCFVLQPIAENAITHGLNGMSSDGITIIIKSHYENENLIITIKNNGQLIEQKEMELINERLSLEPIELLKSKNETIGIYNVNTRIKLYFGNKYGLKFECTDQFTVVKIVLPIHIDLEKTPLFGWYEVN